MRRLALLVALLAAFVATPGAADPSCTEQMGTAGNDLIRGSAGDDCLFGGKGDDRIEGRAGDDHLEGGFGRDTLFGGEGDDLIGGGQDRNVIRGGPGNDRISSSNGAADDVDCGPGRDRVVADRGDRFHGCERVHYALSPYPLVTPHSGGAATTLTVYFRALYPAGGGRGQYVIGIVHSGDCRTGYSSLGRVSHSKISRGDTVRFVVPPGPHGGWCPGLFRGVGHWEGPNSEDIRLGRFFFRVRG